VHLHTTAQNWQAKLQAATEAGCLRFDGALRGIGGCPMANDDLVGNMDSLLMMDYFKKTNQLPAINETALNKAIAMADRIFH
jgi:hydroxymethylglutaryl-CoA lyase